MRSGLRDAWRRFRTRRKINNFWASLRRVAAFVAGARARVAPPRRRLAQVPRRLRGARLADVATGPIAPARAPSEAMRARALEGPNGRAQRGLRSRERRSALARL